MHNGVYETLEEVVDFYNRGGGLGLGLDVPNQTLPGAKLNLSASEKADLVAFLKSMNDLGDLNKTPKRLPAFPAESGLNDRPVGGAY